MKNIDFKLNSNNELPACVVHSLKAINRNNPLPLYQQLLQSLYSVLEKRKLKPGSFFATELLMQKETGVSRSTIRRALEELTRRGLLVRITGKGTFVALPGVHVTVPELKSLTQELMERGMKPGTVFLEAKWTSFPDYLKEQIENKKSLLVRRIRTGNGIPLLYSSIYIPEDIGITDDMNFSGSVYEKLKNHGRTATTAIQTIKATIITKEVAKLLGVSDQVAGLFIQRKTYDQNGEFILYEEGVGRGDHYSYTLKMQRYPQI